MRYLLDTNVLVAALRSSQGASHALVRRALQGELPLVVHQKLVYEYRDVLSRPTTLADTGLAWADAELVLAHLVARAQEVHVRYLWRPNLRDEGDNHLIELAVAGGAHAVVTHNVRDLRHGELSFEHLRVLTPAQCLERWP